MDMGEPVLRPVRLLRLRLRGGNAHLSELTLAILGLSNPGPAWHTSKHQPLQGPRAGVYMGIPRKRLFRN